MRTGARVRWLGLAGGGGGGEGEGGGWGGGAALADSPLPVQSESAGQPAPAEDAWGTTVSTPAGRQRQYAARRSPLARAVRRWPAHPLIAFELSDHVPFSAFRLTRPYRVVIDLAEVEFVLPARPGARAAVWSPPSATACSRRASHASSSIPWGRSASNSSPRAAPRRPDPRLEVDLVPSTATEFAASEIATAAHHRCRSRKPRAAAAKPPTRARAAGRRRRSRAWRHRSRRVRRAAASKRPGAGGRPGDPPGLLASRRYEVVMTRSSDVFVSLDQRVRLSRHHQADLFVSIHADSLARRIWRRTCAARRSTPWPKRPPTTMPGAWPRRRMPSTCWPASM